MAMKLKVCAGAACGTTAAEGTTVAERQWRSEGELRATATATARSIRSQNKQEAARNSRWKCLPGPGADISSQKNSQEQLGTRHVFARAWEELKSDQQHADEVVYPIVLVQDFHDPDPIDIFVMLADLVPQQRGRDQTWSCHPTCLGYTLAGVRQWHWKDIYDLQLQLQPGVSAARRSKKQPETAGEKVSVRTWSRYKQPERARNS